MEHDDNGLEVLSSEECMRLLAGQSLGRLALSMGALPVVLPVNYVLLDERVVIRTSRGTRLARAARDTVVAFEVDQVDPETGAGWSVLVQGFARELVDRPDLQAARSAPLARWLDPGDSVHVGVSIDIVTGRRVAAAPVDVRATSGERVPADEPKAGTTSTSTTAAFTT